MVAHELTLEELHQRGRSLSSDEESDYNDDARIRCQFVQSAAEAM